MSKPYKLPCMMCGDCQPLQRHHIHPTGVASLMFVESGPLLHICGHCHKMIHKLFTNDELRTGPSEYRGFMITFIHKITNEKYRRKLLKRMNELEASGANPVENKSFEPKTERDKRRAKLDRLWR